jgi:hypothetical protein
VLVIGAATAMTPAVPPACSGPCRSAPSNVLDYVAEHLPDLDPGLRWRVVTSCRGIVGERSHHLGYDAEAPTLLKNVTRASKALPTAAPAPLGSGNTNTMIARMMIRTQTHLGMARRLLVSIE